jgi:Type ISP C-terminal specificity domain
MFDLPTSIPNLNPQQVQLIESQLNMKLDWDAPIGISLHPSITSLTKDKEGVSHFTPTDLLDYIYAVLHTPQYRSKYKEFLKIDFPRIPFDVNQDTFWQLVEIGGQIRRLHLMESLDSKSSVVAYPIGGENLVTKIDYKNNQVWINETQYFDNVDNVAWQFCIGGYQPAQKWLKDRKGNSLNYEDIAHYQKLIGSLNQTDVLMNQLQSINWMRD